MRISTSLGWAQHVADPLALADRLAAAAAESLPVTGVGLTWRTPQLPGFLVSATDARAAQLEAAELSLGEGPSTSSAGTGRPTLVDDLDSGGSRWPAYTAAAVGLGVAAVFVFPLRLGEVSLGALVLHRDTAGPLLEADVSDALAFATVGSWVLLNLQPTLADDLVRTDLPARLTSRFEVHQAAGILATQLVVDTEEALELLRRRSTAEGRTLDDVAREVIRTL